MWLYPVSRRTRNDLQWRVSCYTSAMTQSSQDGVRHLTRQITQHGGSFGLRDEAMLESALTRLLNHWRYEPETDLRTLGAACGFGIAKNQAFIDGNKRTALQVMYVFPGLNGWRIGATQKEVVERMEGVAASTVTGADLAGWLRGHIVRRRGRKVQILPHLEHRALRHRTRSVTVAPRAARAGGYRRLGKV